MTNDKTRFGIVGCGVIAPWHAESIRQIEQAQLVAVCDVIVERAEAFAEKYGVSHWYTDYDQMLARDDLDVINICTPSGLHAQIGIAAARTGRHILTEKPIDITLPQIDKLIRTCWEQEVKLAVIFQRRTSPVFKRAKQIIDEGWLGPLVLGDAYLKYYRSQAYYDSGDWRGTRALDGGGALMNQGVHCVDVLQWFMGPVKRIYGYARTMARRMETEDTAAAVLEFANGAIGVLEGTTSVYPGLDHRIEIHGSKGTLLIEGEQIVRLDIEEGQKPLLDLPVPEEQDGMSSDPTAIGMEGHRIQILDLINAIKEDRDPLVTGEEARKAVEIILSIYRSSETGQPVTLPLTD